MSTRHLDSYFEAGVSRARQKLAPATPQTHETRGARAQSGELFVSGHSNGRGVDVRRYVEAQRRSVPDPRLALRPPSTGARGSSAESGPEPRELFDVAKGALAGLPRGEGQRRLIAEMIAIIDELRADATWPVPLVPGQGEYAGPGFERPLRVGDDGIEIPEASEVRAWVDAGGLDAFRGAIRDWARAVGARFPVGHPERGVALASAYEAFTRSFYAHVGDIVRYEEIGTRRDVVPDWADLVSVPFAVVSKDPSDFRSAIDCDGYTMLAAEFFEAAGMRTFANMSMSADGYHKQGIAVDAGVVVGFSNEVATELPQPGEGLGERFRDWVREKTFRRDLRLEPRVFEAAALRLRNDAHGL